MEMTAHQLPQTPSELQFSFKTTLDNLKPPETEKEDSPHQSTSEPQKLHAKCFQFYGREENQPPTPKSKCQRTSKLVTKPKLFSNQRCHFALMLMMCANLWDVWLLWTPTVLSCLDVS